MGVVIDMNTGTIINTFVENKLIKVWAIIIQAIVSKHLVLDRKKNIFEETL